MVSSSAEKMAVECIKKREESPEVHRAAAAWCDFIFHFGILSRQILGVACGMCITM